MLKELKRLFGKPALVFGVTEARNWSKSIWCTTEDTAKEVGSFYSVGNGTRASSPVLLFVYILHY